MIGNLCTFSDHLGVKILETNFGDHFSVRILKNIFGYILM
jgi:hypothetical protein